MNPFSNHPKTLSRRKFLGEASCATLGSTALLSTMLNLRLANRAAAETLPTGNDYKAVICLFLAGGNDSHNMLIPREVDEYAHYVSARGVATGDTGGLALTPEEVLEITDPRSGRRFGVHNGLTELKGLYDTGDLAFLANVGTLVEPMTIQEYQSGSKKRPLGLFSHSDQQMHWQSSVPDQRSSIGWGGRMGDLLGALNDNTKISMNISLNGSNVFQSGNQVTEYAIGSNGSTALAAYDWDTNFRTATNSLLDQEYANLFKSTYANMTRNALEAHEEFSSAIDEAGDLTTEFPDTNFGDRLKMIARTIKARGSLDMRRQCFFVENSGWDHHDDVLNNQNDMFPEVSQAVAAFWAAMGELGMQDDVLLFTASDFGRTLSSNGQGSDHAWAGNQFILGGGINGGRIYGNYPEDLRLGNPLDVDQNRGRLLPTTSVDEYFAELACWMGVSNGNLADVLPNIGRFYTPGSGTPPLGMFSS